MEKAEEIAMRESEREKKWLDLVLSFLFPFIKRILFE
jgi:hypothetical protein